MFYRIKQGKRSHDHLLHPQSSQCQILWLLQTPVQVEGKHLQAGLQRAAGVLWRLSVLQPVLQVNYPALVCSIISDKEDKVILSLQADAHITAAGFV